VLLCLAATSLHCRPDDDAARLAADNEGTRNPLSLQELDQTEKARVFAAISDAVYCGDEASCSVHEAYEKSRQLLGLSFDLKDWSMEFLSARDQEKDIEGYVFFRPDRDDVIIAFRGSDHVGLAGGFQDWVSTNARMIPVFYGGKRFSGHVHQGFLNGMYGVWHPNHTGLIKALSDHDLWNKRFWLTGHSLGGAVATLVGMRLSDEDKRIAGIYTYGSPRIAHWNFQGSYNGRLKDVTFQYVTSKDPVPRLLLHFVAVGKTYVIEGQSAREVDKDGAPAWTILNAFASGDFQAHALDWSASQGYLQTMISIR
jgi:hypothetical protein